MRLRPWRWYGGFTRWHQVGSRGWMTQCGMDVSDLAAWVEAEVVDESFRCKRCEAWRLDMIERASER